MIKTAYATIPPDLKGRPQWVCWCLEQCYGKATKIPIDPHTGRKASTKDPATWGSFHEALAAMPRYGCQGVGFVFAANDRYCGVDLDNCINDAGNLSGLATGIVEKLNSYTAFSQSGNGLHVIVNATLPQGRRQGDFGGLYDAGRFFALTGNLYPGAPTTIEDRQAEIDVLHAELFPPPKRLAPPINRPTSYPVSLTNNEIIHKMLNARNSANVRRLWEGDVSNYDSHSEADLALCSHLAFWCGGDASRIDSLFRKSGLYREAKWNRQDYRQHTISKALEQGRYYNPDYLTFSETSGGRRPSRIIVEVV